ncbi:ABC transporter substrate-binding protein [Aquabacterium sp. A7-Y]|uniref:ABC transporter substrate-binding protein n=1 Tax=Aquabacterium sp. A7-Y TaxID=1349605 RepID=UPI00223E657B|nr:ABC transporter substrate-binding protein [Aquabacterium sp. A7-Y]MCW7539404.1 ABC transporter substrate-binding protein [Aquabacterium sp. A7-Y]
MLPALRRSLLAVAVGAAAGAAHADIVVAQVAPFSGPQAVTGRAIHAGAKLYIDAVNARGGVRGQRIKLVTRDDAQKPEETVRLVKEVLQQEAPVALIGTVGTSNLEALARDGVLDKYRVSMVGAVSGAASVAQSRSLRVVKASYHDEIDSLFSKLSQLGLKRVGVVFQDDGLGKDVNAGVDKAARRYGITLVSSTGYPRNTTDVTPAVNNMLKAGPQVIFLGATTAAAVQFVKQYGAAGGQATMYGMSIIDTEALLKTLGPDRARGYAFSVVLPLSSKPDREVVREYLRLSEAGQYPDLSARSMEGFIAAKALVKALEKTPRPSAESVTAALDAAAELDLGGYRLDFSKADRSGSRYVDFAMIGDGGRIVQ